jgi:AcrR family transcriptional regulator
MAAATDIVTDDGLEGLTMQAVAERVGCAVGTIYTYFDSKSALLSALQVSAIQTLMSSYHAAAEMWESELDESELDEAVASLVRLVAFGRVFVASSDLHPREFELLQMLISTRQDLTTNEDRDSVLPIALALINDFRVLIDEAIEVGALTSVPTAGAPNDIEDPDSSLNRTLRWAGGLNGAMLVSNVGVDPARINPALFDGRRLALSLADDMLVGWGAPPRTLASAHAFIEQMAERERLLPPGDPAPQVVDTDASEKDESDDGSSDQVEIDLGGSRHAPSRE